MSTFLTCFHLNQTSFTEQSGNFTHTCNTATTTFRSRNPSIISTIFPPPSPPRNGIVRYSNEQLDIFFTERPF